MLGESVVLIQSRELKFPLFQRYTHKTETKTAFAMKSKNEKNSKFMSVISENSGQSSQMGWLIDSHSFWIEMYVEYFY